MKMDDVNQSMKKESLTVNRSSVRISADPSRVIARPFIPGGGNRLRAIINRILDLSESEVFRLLSQVLEDFSSRHKNIKDIFNRHYDLVSHHINGQWPISDERRWLIGSYFTNEYSLESVAMFNPSMVLHPDQSRQIGVNQMIRRNGFICGHVGATAQATATWRSISSTTWSAVMPSAAAS